MKHMSARKQHTNTRTHNKKSTNENIKDQMLRKRANSVARILIYVKHTDRTLGLRCVQDSGLE